MQPTPRPNPDTSHAEGDDWIVPASDAGRRLDVWLAGRPTIGSRTRARDAVARGKVLLNGETVDLRDAGRELTAGDVVRFWADRPGSARRQAAAVVARRGDLAVVLEDGEFLVVNKPPGLLVEPLPGVPQTEVTLVDLVADHLRFAPGRSVRVVHRIDRDTSGLVLFARNERAQLALKAQFERGSPLRLYLAVVHGRVEPPSGTWRDRITWDRERLVQKRAHPREARGKEAEARYRVLEQFQTTALLEVQLVTGKRNQIRYQTGARGHPLVGERIYTFGSTFGGGWPSCARQALHAWRLGFVHPTTGRDVRVEADPPADFEALVAAVRRGPRPVR